LCWFVGLTVGTIVTSVLMWIFLEWMIGRENDEKTRVASPLYMGEATVRPGPELLPNPAQKYEKDPMKRYVLPWDHYGYFVKDEGVKLKRVGLENGEGRPALPADAVDEVLRELTSSVAPTKERYPQELMPSEGSGGVHEAIQVLAK
jgi:hypothetical protein